MPGYTTTTRPNTLVSIGDVLSVIGLTIAPFGIITNSILLMALGSLLYAVSYWLRDCFGTRRDSISAMTVYSVLIGTWMSGSNLAAMYYENTPYRVSFFVYALPEYFIPAQKLSIIMVILPLLASRLVFERAGETSKRGFSLPEIGFETTPRATVMYCTILVVVSWVNRILGATYLKGIGSLGYVLTAGPYLAIFILTYQCLGPRSRLPRNTMMYVILLATADSTYALLFEYMRGPVIYPFFCLFLATFLRKKFFSPKVFFSFMLILGLLMLVYKPLGVLRGEKVGGSERFNRLVAMMEESDEDPFSSKTEEDLDVRNDYGAKANSMTLLARGCQYDQLTQVVALADREGFLGGSSLSYMIYVFIPRVIWPDKPLVSSGGWFAYKIGRAREIAPGRYSNSINMNLVGEFFLNFSWLGAILGVIIYTMIVCLIWQSAGLYRYECNPAGQTLAAICLLQVSSSTGATGIVQMPIIYLMCWAIVAGLRIFFAKQGPSVMEARRDRPQYSSVSY